MSLQPTLALIASHNTLSQPICILISCGGTTRARYYTAELTIAFETSFTAAAEHKRIKYDSVVQRARDAGYSVTFLPLEVGSRAIVNLQSFATLKEKVGIPQHPFSAMLLRVVVNAIKSCHQIWCTRNRLWLP